MRLRAEISCVRDGEVVRIPVMAKWVSAHWAITRAIRATPQPGKRVKYADGWELTHLPTGRTAGTIPASQISAAMVALDSLAELDWTGTGDIPREWPAEHKAAIKSVFGLLWPDRRCVE